MANPTILEQLVEEYPNLDYDGGAFYASKEDEHFIIDSEGDNLDADWIIELHYQDTLKVDVDRNYIVDHFGSYDNAFKNAY